MDPNAPKLSAGVDNVSGGGGVVFPVFAEKVGELGDEGVSVFGS